MWPYRSSLITYRCTGYPASWAAAVWSSPPSTLGQWAGETGVALQPVVDALKDAVLTRRVLHADETPVAMLDPGAGKTKRAYVWSYCTTVYDAIQGVVYDFAESRAGLHAKEFLGDWKGILVCDNYSGYKQLLTQGVVDAGCLAHSRRKFFDLYVNHKSQVAEAALPFYSHLYQIEKRAMDLTADERQQLRQSESRPIAQALLAGWWRNANWSTRDPLLPRRSTTA